MDENVDVSRDLHQDETRDSGSTTEQGFEVYGDPDADVFEIDADADANADEEPLAVEVRKFQEEINHLQEMYLRKLAEFDNFRKRTDRERAEREKLAGIDVVQDLIPVIDNFERALDHASESTAEALAEGVGMIARQLTDVLERRGLEIFDPTGQPFDPENHEAIQRVEDPNLEPGTIAWTLAKGYRYGGRLLRPAMVGVVAERPAPTPANEEEGNER